MITLNQIQSELIPSDKIQSTDNFVAAAVQLNEDGVAHHAGFIIHYNGSTTLIHYYGEILIEGVPSDNWYFHKDLIFVGNLLTAAFYTHCQLIEVDANPDYAFFYPGSFYKDGKYFSDIATKEYMTCVGFCLNVIKGFIEEKEYIQYTDWNINSIQSKEHKKYLSLFIKKIKTLYPEAEVKKIMGHIRRISPDEYFSTAYLAKAELKDLPITKSSIDEILPNVKAALQSKVI